MEIKVEKRHGVWNKIVSPFISSYLKKQFGYTFEKCDIKPPYLVLANHTTDYDAFFIAKSFKNHLYFVMSDHVSSIPVVGKLVRHLVSPIPITKSTSDPITVRKIMSVIKQGAPVALFPEGNKSFSGEMSEMKHSIAKLAKKLNVPVVIYNITGGYFCSPRWTKNKRKGHVHGAVKCIISPEEMKNMTDEELFRTIKDNLRVNAYEVQEKEKQTFKGKNLAQNIETFLYVCPSCHSISSLHGKGDRFYCDKCDFESTYDEFGYVHNKFFSRLDEFDKWQKQYLKTLDYNAMSEDQVITSDSGFTIKKKIDNYKSKKVGVFTLSCFKNRFELENPKQKIIIPFEDIAGYALEGVNGIQLHIKDGTIYRFKNEYTISGLKYLNIYCTITGTEMRF